MVSSHCCNAFSDFFERSERCIQIFDVAIDLDFQCTQFFGILDAKCLTCFRG